jgi:hypothetical protein
MDTTSIDQQLLQILESAWAQGSPVAGSGSAQRSEIAAVALRRMQSFSSRGVPDADTSRQVVDLAKGLAAHFESKPELVGPLIKDYQHIAALLLERYRMLAPPNKSLERTREG